MLDGAFLQNGLAYEKESYNEAFFNGAIHNRRLNGRREIKIGGVYIIGVGFGCKCYGNGLVV